MYRTGVRVKILKARWYYLITTYFNEGEVALIAISISEKRIWSEIRCSKINQRVHIYTNIIFFII